MKVSYNYNSVEYNEIVSKFIDDFIKAFPQYNRNEIENTMHRNVKKILYNDNAKTGFAQAMYFINMDYILVKTPKQSYVSNHECLHALSNNKGSLSNRTNWILKTFKDKYNNLNEGITEFINWKMLCKKNDKDIAIVDATGYKAYTSITNKLNEIFGTKELLDLYFNNDDDIESKMNNNIPNSFDTLMNLMTNIHGYSADGMFLFNKVTNPDKAKIESDCIYNILDSMLKKYKLKEVKTVDDFKFNLETRIKYDIYRISEIKKYSYKTNNYIMDFLNRLTDDIRHDWELLNNKEELNFNVAITETISSISNYDLTNFNEFVVSSNELEKEVLPRRKTLEELKELRTNFVNFNYVDEKPKTK